MNIQNKFYHDDNVLTQATASNTYATIQTQLQTQHSNHT